MVVKIEELEKSSDYDDQDFSKGKPPKKPARKPNGQKRKFVSKLVSRNASREQRSSSEDSLLKLLQSNPTIYEADDDEDCFAISRQSYERLNKYKTESGQSEYIVDDKSEVEQTDSEDTQVCYNAEIKSYSSTITMPVGQPQSSSVTQNLTELDTLLADLSSARYTAAGGQHTEADLSSARYTGAGGQHTDYYSDDYSQQQPHSSPARPPPPKNYGGEKPSKKAAAAPPSVSSVSSSPVPPVAARIPRRRPPKLMHVLSKDGRTHDLCKEAREDYNMDIDVDLDMDYDYSFSGSTMGGNISNYSTLRTTDTREREQDYDYGTLNKSSLPVSEDELEKATGAGPRGDRSRLIETDSGVVQSKYRYMGFGLWENLDPAAPKKVKKKSPPPPPPKAEPIMYACTVSVSKTISSKELDDLVAKDMFNKMRNGEVEVADGVGDLGEGIGEPFEMFEKEDMSDMFKRAMLEKMQLVDDPPAKYRCCVCDKLIQGRVLTAMGNKFHPQCFVCTYCRSPFKERKYKTDPRDRKPYCKDCFEKLLGHFGDAHDAIGHYYTADAAAFCAESAALG